ncbi:MAG: effector binding domain-containing protein [Flavobacteriaceae bacterium]|jgi:predicted transcriptional regulator YdeE|nr:effector binding domain-containing protein [Flavobacteriaceae bacterium]
MDSLIKIEKMFVVGVTVRTDNVKGIEDGINLEKKFISEQVEKRVLNRITHNVYLVYTDYEHGFFGAFTMTLGVRVSSPDNVPEGLELKEIPASYYRVFLCKKNSINSAQEMWMNIVQKYNKEMTYVVNFDVYVGGLSTKQYSTKELFVSVKHADYIEKLLE